jgi:hypothetical protein
MSALALPTRSQCAEDRVLPNDAFTKPQRAQAAGRISLVTKVCSTVLGCQYSRAQERTLAKMNNHQCASPNCRLLAHFGSPAAARSTSAIGAKRTSARDCRARRPGACRHHPGSFSRRTRRLRCSSLSLNLSTAATSAVSRSGASTRPRYSVRLRMSHARQVRISGFVVVGQFMLGPIALWGGRGTAPRTGRCSLPPSCAGSRR